jgi:hypothetical protein
MKIRPVGAELFHAGSLTDITKLTVAFRRFANAPENGQIHFKFVFRRCTQETHQDENIIFVCIQKDTVLLEQALFQVLKGTLAITVPGTFLSPSRLITSKILKSHGKIFDGHKMWICFFFVDFFTDCKHRHV